MINFDFTGVKRVSSAEFVRVVVEVVVKHAKVDSFEVCSFFNVLIHDDCTHLLQLGVPLLGLLLGLIFVRLQSSHLFFHVLNILLHIPFLHYLQSFLKLGVQIRFVQAFR